MLEAKQKELQNAMYTDNNGQNSFDAEEAMLAVSPYRHTRACILPRDISFRAGALPGC